MPKYNVAKATEALLLVKAGDLSMKEIAVKVGIGESTLSRYCLLYRASEMRDVDVGPLPDPRTGKSAKRRRKDPKVGPLKQASYLRIVKEHFGRLEEGLAYHEEKCSQLERLLEWNRTQVALIRAELARIAADWRNE